MAQVEGQPGHRHQAEGPGRRAQADPARQGQQERQEAHRPRFRVDRQGQEDAHRRGVSAYQRADRERREEQGQDVVEMGEADRDLHPHRDEGGTRYQDALLQAFVVEARAPVVVGGGPADQDQHVEAQAGHERVGEFLADGEREGCEESGDQEADRADLEFGVVGVEGQPAARLAG
ncbi:hypothetical protein ACQ4WX_28075 [Streptomyces lasalocidi]